MISFFFYIINADFAGVVAAMSGVQSNNKSCAGAFGSRWFFRAFRIRRRIGRGRFRIRRRMVSIVKYKRDGHRTEKDKQKKKAKSVDFLKGVFIGYFHANLTCKKIVTNMYAEKNRIMTKTKKNGFGSKYRYRLTFILSGIKISHVIS